MVLKQSFGYLKNNLIFIDEYNKLGIFAWASGLWFTILFIIGLCNCLVHKGYTIDLEKEKIYGGKIWPSNFSEMNFSELYFDCNNCPLNSYVAFSSVKYMLVEVNIKAWDIISKNKIYA